MAYTVVQTNHVVQHCMSWSSLFWLRSVVINYSFFSAKNKRQWWNWVHFGNEGHAIETTMSWKQRECFTGACLNTQMAKFMGSTGAHLGPIGPRWPPWPPYTMYMVCRYCVTTRLLWEWSTVTFVRVTCYSGKVNWLVPIRCEITKDRDDVVSEITLIITDIPLQKYKY